MSEGKETDLSGVMRRISKLLAIAGDSRADPAEAAAAAAMAEKVMRKYQLDHADVICEQLKQAENFDTADQPVVMKKGKGHHPTKVPAWAQWLGTAVAKLHDCEVRLAYSAQHGACIRFFGFKSDVVVCAWTFDFLTTNLIRNCREFQKQTRRDKSESESYRRGFVVVLIDKINTMVAEKEKEQAAESGSRSLMVVKKQALTEKFGEFKYKNGKGINHSDASAFSAGVRDGNKVDVGRKALQGGANPNQLSLELQR